MTYEEMNGQMPLTKYEGIDSDEIAFRVSGVDRNYILAAMKQMGDSGELLAELLKRSLIQQYASVAAPDLGAKILTAIINR